MPSVWVQKIMSYHRIKKRSSNLHIILGKDFIIKFKVVRYLQNLLAFKKRLENFQHREGFLSIFGNGNIVRQAFSVRKTHPDKFRLKFIERSRFRIKTNCLLSQ